MKPTGTIIRVDAIGPQIEPLIEAATNEGFHFMETLRREWADGSNRFDLTGEAYLAIRNRDRVVAAGGLNRDPYAGSSEVGRVRHVYVLPDFRRTGAGRALLDAIVGQARAHFTLLRLRTRTEKGAAFYEALGFIPCADETATHLLQLRPDQ